MADRLLVGTYHAAFSDERAHQPRRRDVEGRVRGRRARARIVRIWTPPTFIAASFRQW
jgi:hypothetical protein